jgi:hypothetical protein
MQPNKNPNWHENAKEILEGEKMKECTFRPETKEYKRDKSKENPVFQAMRAHTERKESVSRDKC